MSMEDFYTEVDQTQAVWNELYELLLRGKYDTEAPRAVINNISVVAFHQRVELVFELLHAMRPKSEKDISCIEWSNS
jgi:hypothetical protein